MIKLERERFIRQGYNDIGKCRVEAETINKAIEELSPDLYGVNPGTLETIYIKDGYIYYDFRSFMYSYKFVVNSGYYFKIKGKINDDRIGRRKLYKTKKGQYFIQNGYRNYLKDYTEYKGGVKKW